MSSLVGKRFGQYQVSALLGEGGMATVYRAGQPAMGRDVALKVIKPELAENPEFLERFDREARTIAALSHPYILKIFEYGQQKKTTFLAMELLTGGSLAARMRHSPSSLTEINAWTGQIASALDHAHGLGIAHRDLKPQNVMLDGSGNAILTDFGLAKAYADSNRTALTMTGAQMGTPAYMPPEQWRGEPIDARADIYAFGGLVYEMLAGVPPFRSDSPFEMMHKHLFVEPAPIIRVDLPSAVNLVLARAMAKDRDARYDSAGAFYQAFVSAMGVTPVQIAYSHPDSHTVIFTSRVDSQPPTPMLNGNESSASGTPARRLLSALPQDVSTRYFGRERERADIVNLLLEGARLVSLYGRGGAGKTALACRALLDLQYAQEIDGIVALSAVNGTARLDKILLEFAAAIGGEARDLLEGLARDGQMNPVQKTAVLLESLRDRRYALFIDNLETVQDSDSGEITDTALKQFVESVLESGGAIRLLITSREPLALPRHLKTWERVIRLDAGLPQGEAVDLLRAFDPDNSAGLREASSTILRQFAERTGGFPRALEAVAGLLLEDPLLTPEDLLSDMRLFSGEVTPLIVGQAISRLPQEAVQVMQAIALYGHPVTQSAVDYLLERHAPPGTARTALARLVRTYFASFNRANSQFSLHPIDREYCYAMIPEGSADGFDLATLHRRAAGYYRTQRKPRDQWLTREDLMPQLNEFEHLVQAGEYDQAARLVFEISKDYLWEWGERDLLEGLHRRLDGCIRDPILALQNERRLLWNTMYVGDLAESFASMENLLARARELGDAESQADILDEIGQLWRAQAHYVNSFDTHRQAYQLYQQIGNRRGQGEALGGMGTSLQLDDPDGAMRYLREAEAIQRELGHQHSLAYVVATLGSTSTLMGNYPQAIAYLQEAIALSQQLNNHISLVQSWMELGEVYSHLGDKPLAQVAMQQAAQHGDRLGGYYDGNIYPAMMKGFMAGMYARLGDLSGGITMAEEAARLAETIKSPFARLASMTLAMLYLAGERIDEAHSIVKRLIPGDYPIPPVYHSYIGIIFARAGDREQATHILSEVLAMIPADSKHVTPLFARAHALAGLAALNEDAALAAEAHDTYARGRRCLVDAVGFLWSEGKLLRSMIPVDTANVLTASLELFPQHSPY